MNALPNDLAGFWEKGDRHHLPERPGGCLAQMVPVTFFPLVDAPVWVALLLKITAILAAAWLAHLALARANPRWRVLLWRVTAAGLIALPAAAWSLPALRIRSVQISPTCSSDPRR